MNLESKLRKELVAAAKSFGKSLDHIDPTAHPGKSESGNYPERMISYYYIQAISRALAPASVFLELPVTGKLGQRMDNHIDALIFNDHDMVAAEFKVGWAQSHWDALAKDLARLQGPAAREVRKKFIDKRRRRSWIFLGTDCWRQNIANIVWKLGNPEKRRALPAALGRAHRDYVTVWKDEGPGFDGYYLTWALLPFDKLRT